MGAANQTRGGEQSGTTLNVIKRNKPCMALRYTPLSRLLVHVGSQIGWLRSGGLASIVFGVGLSATANDFVSAEVLILGIGKS